MSRLHSGDQSTVEQFLVTWAVSISIGDGAKVGHVVPYCSAEWKLPIRPFPKVCPCPYHLEIKEVIVRQHLVYQLVSLYPVHYGITSFLVVARLSKECQKELGHCLGLIITGLSYLVAYLANTMNSARSLGSDFSSEKFRLNQCSEIISD